MIIFTLIILAINIIVTLFSPEYMRGMVMMDITAGIIIVAYMCSRVMPTDTNE